MSDLLLIWNGMATQQVSGGDIYIKKFIENSDKKFDVILSKNARNILEGKNLDNLLITDNKSAEGSFKLIFLYITRIVKSLTTNFRNQPEHDIVIASSPFLCDVVPTIFTKSTTKIVVLFHILPKRTGTNISTKIRFFLAYLEQKASLYLIHKKFQVILAGNEELKCELRKKFPNKKIIVAHAGINTERMDRVIAEKKDANLGIFVGRLTMQKGILDLVDIVKKIESVNPKFKMIIIGNGPDKQLLITKTKKQGVNSIELLGFINEKLKYGLMKQATFFIFPSYEEGWGIALAEAMYCNCLCFCYELSHYRGLFSNYPVYINTGDKMELATQLIENYAAKVKKGQKEFISKYDDKCVINDVLKGLL